MPEIESYVRVACDFGADGLWDERGRAYRPETLRLSPALCLALRAWQLHHDEAATVVSGNPFNDDAHDDIGRQLVALVRAERPDLKVIYAYDPPFPGDSYQR